jgi:ATP-dependent exoDNAse (exonuclease V) beta subunit
VDEYQDVNAVQQALFELLCGADCGAPGPLLVAVGDLKQSIYRFRGADVAVFARLVRRFEAGAGRVLYLSENHRSAPAVLELVNEVSARALQPPAGEASRDDEIAFGPRDRLIPTRPEAERPACELLVDEREGEGERDGGGETSASPARSTAAERRAREARALASRVAAMISGAAGVVVRERGGGGEAARLPRFGDVAILFRRLTQVAPYERALREAGIPYRLTRGGGFYQASEVRDLGELLATLADPSDAVAWAASLRSPACAVSDGTLLLLARVGLARLARLAPAVLTAELERVGAPGAVPADERARLDRFLCAWRDLHALRDRLALPELLGRAVESLDLDVALLAGPDGERRAVNLEKALALAGRFARDGGTAAELAVHLRVLAGRPPREPEAELEAGDAVALLSVHQAKGLEWPIVIVPDLGARPPPDSRRALLDGTGRLCAQLLDPARETFLETASARAAREAEKRSAIAESRRLLYVALTRARDHLVLSGEGSSGAESWRGLVEAALAERPDLVRRVRMCDAATAAAGPVELRGDLRPEPGAAEPAGSRRTAALATPPPVPAVRLSVTELAELVRCPRRHLLGRVLGLREPRGVSGAPLADDPARATARGTLAHGMLAETDLAASPLERRAQLAAAAARRGYDPSNPGVRKILAEVVRFSESPGGRALALAAREGRLSREVPFLLRLEGDGPPAVYLGGALDALVRERRGELTVIDFKYATPRAGAADRYRVQLVAYVLAAARAHPGLRVGARLQFLRGDHRAVDVTPSGAELARLEALAPLLARTLVAPTDVAPASLGREAARCRAEGCGYVARCFPGQTG